MLLLLLPLDDETVVPTVSTPILHSMAFTVAIQRTVALTVAV